LIVAALALGGVALTAVTVAVTLAGVDATDAELAAAGRALIVIVPVGWGATPGTAGRTGYVTTGRASASTEPAVPASPTCATGSALSGVSSRSSQGPAKEPS
jgi:hypothetical protein